MRIRFCTLTEYIALDYVVWLFVGDSVHLHPFSHTVDQIAVFAKYWTIMNNWSFTFIHPSEQVSEVFWSGIRLVLLPRVTIVTPQHNQLPLFPPHGPKMRDLHNYRTKRIKHSWRIW